MKWQIKAQIQAIDPQERLNEILQTLLTNRGLKTESDIDDFLSPKNPADIPLTDLGVASEELNKTVQRIKQAVTNQEQVVVYGDYDADGITATAIMWETLNELGAKVMPYLPDRFTEGYGMKISAIKNLQLQYPDLKLIITVDQGIIAHEQISYCNQQQIDVIVTDHHQPDDQRPSAHSIIHTTKISGSAVAWWLSQEIKCHFEKVTIPDNKLELATIGTVADVLPLLAANRSLVAYGITALQQTKRPGLLQLYNSAKLDSKNLETYHIGFVIGPRLNAMGRLAHPIDSLRLICTKDVHRAWKLAQTLNHTNQQRQDITQKAVDHAKQIANEQTHQKIIIVSDHSYSEGIIGLIAGKLVEEFHRPAIVLSVGEQYSKASARSIKTYNIIEAIRSAGQWLLNGGGHPMAAGFTIANENLEAFSQHLFLHANETLTTEDLERRLEIEASISLTDINDLLYEKIQMFSPFGLGNLDPMFSTNGVTLISAQLVGKQQQHLKLLIAGHNRSWSGIAFNQAHRLNELRSGSQINIAYTIDKNVWMGQISLQLKIKDWNFS